MSKTSQRQLADRQRRRKSDPKYKPSLLEQIRLEKLREAERSAFRQVSSAPSSIIYEESTRIKS